MSISRFEIGKRYVTKSGWVTPECIEVSDCFGVFLGIGNMSYPTCVEIIDIASEYPPPAPDAHRERLIEAAFSILLRNNPESHYSDIAEQAVKYADAVIAAEKEGNT